jgi:hypothetical protein
VNRRVGADWFGGRRRVHRKGALGLHGVVCP